MREILFYNFLKTAYARLERKMRNNGTVWIGSLQDLSNGVPNSVSGWRQFWHVFTSPESHIRTSCRFCAFFCVGRLRLWEMLCACACLPFLAPPSCVYHNNRCSGTTKRRETKEIFPRFLRRRPGCCACAGCSFRTVLRY